MTAPATPALIHGRPVIGVMLDENTSSGGGSYDTSKAYIRAVSAAGGVPVALVYEEATPDLALAICHGLMVTGGRVRFPDHWYEPGPVSSSPQSERIAIESDLIPRWLQTGRPYLGICHGMQAFAALQGARLTPDLRARNPDSLVHDTPEARHAVAVTPGSLLHRVTGVETLQVNSLHREAVVTIPDDLAISGHAPDGTIEAVELTGHSFALGVQWHPERFATGASSDESVSAAQARALFSAFVSASAAWVCD